MRKLAEAGCTAVFMPTTLYHPGSGGGGGGGTAAPAAAAAGGGGAVDAGLVVGASEEADPEAHETWVTVERLSRGLCAQSRPHFFRGVCTVRCWGAQRAAPSHGRDGATGRTGRLRCWAARAGMPLL